MCDDVCLIWDEMSANEAVFLLFEKREITLYCECSEGDSIYNPLSIDVIGSEVPEDIVVYKKTNEKGKGILMEQDNLEEEESDTEVQLDRFLDQQRFVFYWADHLY